MSKPIYITGSDGNQYIIESEQIGYGTLELSLITSKARIDNGIHLDNSNLPKDLVEQYIASIKRVYAPEIYKISMIHHTLNSKQVNNYFDYLNVLQQINPILSELLHK